MKKKLPTPLNVRTREQERGINIVRSFIPRQGPTRRRYNVMAISSQPKLKGHTDERSRNASRIEPIFIFQQNTELQPKLADCTRTVGKKQCFNIATNGRAAAMQGKTGAPRREGNVAKRAANVGTSTVSSVQRNSYVVVDQACVLPKTRHGNWINQTTMWCDFQVRLLLIQFKLKPVI